VRSAPRLHERAIEIAPATTIGAPILSRRRDPVVRSRRGRSSRSCPRQHSGGVVDRPPCCSRVTCATASPPTLTRAGVLGWSRGRLNQNLGGLFDPWTPAGRDTTSGPTRRSLAHRRDGRVGLHHLQPDPH